MVPVNDGLRLAVRLYGTSPGPATGRLPVVCLAGLTRNGRDFHQMAELLSTDPVHPRMVVTIDSRGRGQSGRDPDKSRYTVPVEAADVVSVLQSLGIAKADFIGTSRGGLILHVLAGTAPDMLGALVLNDIGPAVEIDGMRLIQTYLDPDPRPRPRRELVRGLRLVHGDAFSALVDRDWEDMVDALYRPAEPQGQGEAGHSLPDTGMMMADFDPAIAAAVRDLNLSQPLPDLWALFDSLRENRIMVIRGENSTLLSPETVHRMAEHHPGLAVIIARGQGHAPLLHLASLPQQISCFLNA